MVRLYKIDFLLLLFILPFYNLNINWSVIISISALILSINGSYLRQLDADKKHSEQIIVNKQEAKLNLALAFAQNTRDRIRAELRNRFIYEGIIYSTINDRNLARKNIDHSIKLFDKEVETSKFKKFEKEKFDHTFKVVLNLSKNK